MSRPLSGCLLVRRRADGTAFRVAKIRGERATLGLLSEWSKEDAQRFLEATLLPAAREGEYWQALIPAYRDPASKREVRAMADGAGTLTFAEAASDYLAGVRSRNRNGNANTLRDAERPVVLHLLPYFRERPLSECCTPSAIVGFVEAKREEQTALAAVKQVLADLRAHAPDTLDDLDAVLRLLTAEQGRLLMAYGMRGAPTKGEGRKHLLRADPPPTHGRVFLPTAGLGDKQINLCIERLGWIIDRANDEYSLRLRKPKRSDYINIPAANRAAHVRYLRPGELLTYLEAAQTLDSDRHAETSGIAAYPRAGREAMLLVLALLGCRVAELCALRWADVDWTENTLTINGTKTTSSLVRTVQMPTIVRAALKARWDKWGDYGNGLIFPSDEGNLRTRHSVSNKVFKTLEDYARRSDPRVSHIYPHLFRHTMATYRAYSDIPIRETQRVLGHRRSGFTLDCYAQPMDASKQELEQIRGWLDLS